VEGVLKTASSALKRKAPLQETGLSGRNRNYRTGKNTFSYLNGKCFDNLLSNVKIKIPYFRDQTAPGTNFKIYCRRSLNYQIDHRNYTTLSGILEDYNASGCEEENFVLIAKEMGMILSEVFPEATRV